MIRFLLVFCLFSATSNAIAQDRSWLWDVSPIVHDSEGELDYISSGVLFAYDAASFVDLYISRDAVRYGATEANPVMRWAMCHAPLDLVLKSLSILVVNHLFKMAYRIDRFFARLAIGVVLIAQTWIVYRNYQIAMRLQF